jgi:hypothetical protein
MGVPAEETICYPDRALSLDGGGLQSKLII